ncbi:thioredoxin family protein [Lactiplantibacillus plantarum]|uniref:thioredoxin family protein n=1 Tax=Lactiplantibacillus plantarum TaxID=1590 RepID=UPI003F52A316
MTKFLKLLHVYSYKIKIKKPASITEITIDTFKSYLQKGKPHFILIGKPTCPECRRTIDHVIAGIKGEKISIYYLDTDKINLEEKKNTLGKIGIKLLPSLIFFKTENSIKILPNYDSTAAISMWLRSLKR